MEKLLWHVCEIVCIYKVSCSFRYQLDKFNVIMQLPLVMLSDLDELNKTLSSIHSITRGPSYSSRQLERVWMDGSEIFFEGDWGQLFFWKRHLSFQPSSALSVTVIFWEKLLIKWWWWHWSQRFLKEVNYLDPFPSPNPSIHSVINQS